MALNVHWSDCLETLAGKMFETAIERKDPFEMECTVVGSPVMAGWLKQFFLYDYPRENKKQRVLACWDFQMLHPFVNDWLAKACQGTPVGQRNPAQHPYSPGVLQFRIWNELLNDNVPEYLILREYIGEDQKGRDRKRWALAGRLAQLFDDYQNYRADLLENWESFKGNYKDLDIKNYWQAVLWRNLVNDNPQTYVQQFMEMSEKLPNSEIKKAYKRITVFHVSAMPRAYMQFFFEVGQLMDVRMFLFNPSKEFWIDDPTVKQHIKNLMESKDQENLACLEPPHPVLSGFGRGIQSLLATWLDITEGSIYEVAWQSDQDKSLLQAVQADIRHKRSQESKESETTAEADDFSIQFHKCHNPQREVEVVRDLILKWLDDNKNLKPQPRDIQVLVPDMETYAPFIESVFQVNDFNPPIPCVISRRPPVSAGSVGNAFVKLMKLHESRMTALEVIELLELDPVMTRYGLDPEDLTIIRGLVNEAGIRWGRDAPHIKGVLNNNMPDTVTWRRGLDRLLAGFALGRCDETSVMWNAQQLGALRVCDNVEGHIADLTGRLGQFFQDLSDTAGQLDSTKKVSEWAGVYMAILTRFFRGTETSFIELAEIRRGINAVHQAAVAANDPEIASDVMAAAVESHLGGMVPAGKTDVNAVLFSPMRTMQVTPRKLIIMLGLNEGVFPRVDQRPAFDLLAIKPRFGDRSLRYEDRLAFLEGIMAARERLVLTYTGWNSVNNADIPPSPAVTEFLQYLDAFTGRENKISPVEHKLHGFNPQYYHKGSKLFSYSQSNYKAACVLADEVEKPGADNEKVPAGSTKDEPPPGPGNKTITLDELQGFFANPARHFYINTLQVRVLDPGRDNLPDSELFECDGLENYQLKETMLKDMLNQQADADAGVPGADYFHAFQEQSRLPLGVFGVGHARKLWLELQAWLNSTAPHRPEQTLREAIIACQEAGANPVVINVSCGDYTVTGSLPIIEYKDQQQNIRRVLLRCRYASLKTKDKLRGWVLHVVGHAVGDAFETYVKGKEEKVADRILALGQNKAQELLEKMLDYYAQGCRTLLPFAPGCSYEYAKTVALKEEPDAALEAAEKEWTTVSDDDPKDDRDPYLRDAWGEDGPMIAPRFGDIATGFWEAKLNVDTGAQPVEEHADATGNQEEKEGDAHV